MTASSHDSRSTMPDPREHQQRDRGGRHPAAGDQCPVQVGQLAGARQCEREREPRAAGARAASAHRGTCACGRARHEEGARDGVDEHSGILAYARLWN